MWLDRYAVRRWGDIPGLRLCCALAASGVTVVGPLRGPGVVISPDFARAAHIAASGVNVVRPLRGPGVSYPRTSLVLRTRCVRGDCGWTATRSGGVISPDYARAAHLAASGVTVVGPLRGPGV